jgi:hypothetical protein
MKYIKKPLIIEAIQLKEDSSNIEECYQFVKRDFSKTEFVKDTTSGRYKITTLWGVIQLKAGDYIVKGDEEYLVFEENVFNQNYEPIEK